MGRWRFRYRHDMRAQDRQFLIAMIQQGATQDAFIDGEIRVSFPAFDRDFPQAGDAEDELGVGRRAQRAYGLG